MDDLSSIESIVSRYQEGIDFPKPFFDILSEAVQAGNVKVCLTESKDSSPNGFGVIGQVSGRIIAVFVDDMNGELDQEIVKLLEKKIIDWCYNEVNNPPTRVDFPKMTENLKNDILARGYREYQRAAMDVSREVFLRNQEITLPQGFALRPYHPDERGKVAGVLAKANTDHVDAIIYPEFFSSKEMGVEYLKKVEENAFGEYIEGTSRVLMKDNEIIGYCMLVKGGDTVTVSDIGLLPTYQGRGLGKALFVNTLLSYLGSDESIRSIHLAVTLSNPAKFLYEKTGFEVKEEFSAIVYVGTDR
ncbi:MAG: GNAT family N-acetyltransferase [Candidatus Thorarchaeota archaeon]